MAMTKSKQEMVDYIVGAMDIATFWRWEKAIKDRIKEGFKK